MGEFGFLEGEEDVDMIDEGESRFLGEAMGELRVGWLEV